MLGTSAKVTFTATAHNLQIKLPLLTPGNIPCEYAWVLRMDNLQNPNTAIPVKAAI